MVRGEATIVTICLYTHGHTDLRRTLKDKTGMSIEKSRNSTISPETHVTHLRT